MAKFELVVMHNDCVVYSRSIEFPIIDEERPKKFLISGVNKLIDGLGVLFKKMDVEFLDKLTKGELI